MQIPYTISDKLGTTYYKSSWIDNMNGVKLWKLLSSVADLLVADLNQWATFEKMTMTLVFSTLYLWTFIVYASL